MESDRIPKRFYVESVLIISQASNENDARYECMVGVCDGECMKRCTGDEPLTLMRCHSFMNPLKGGSPFLAELTT